MLTFTVCIDGQVCWKRKCLLLFIICRPRKTSFRFHYPFAANKRKLSFLLVRFLFIFRNVSIYIVINIGIDMSLYMDNICIYIYISMSIYKLQFQMESGKQKPGDFPCSSYQKEVCRCPFVYKETYISYLFANGLKQTGPSMTIYDCC